MHSRFVRTLRILNMEDRILAGASLAAIIGVFLPWLSGEWLGGNDVSFRGIGFYTSIIGISIAVLQGFMLTVTLLPVLSRRRSSRYDTVLSLRFTAALLATVLSLAALSVLVRITYEFPRMAIRPGIYLTFIGSLLGTFYAWWAQQHPTHGPRPTEATNETPEPPPPPPPPMDEHRLR